MTSAPGASPATPNAGTALADELRAAVREGLHWLSDVSPERSQHRPRPAGWSAREIVGHLIDSASNNHGRFVRGALQEALVFRGYDQDAWVALHEYNSQDWKELLQRWSAFNEQVASAVERIPTDALRRPRREHNLDQIAWRTIPADEVTTLEYFIRDYIGHLRHHLAQIQRVAED